MISASKAFVKMQVPPTITDGKGKPLAWDVLTWPGKRSISFSSLDPRFATAFQGLCDAMALEGWTVEILTAWRNKAQQAWLVNQGWSKTLESLHCTERPPGTPAALAVDVVPKGVDPNDAAQRAKAARFYVTLRTLAPQHGLITGGSWSKSNPVWDEYGLGWDPGHVEPDKSNLQKWRKS